MRDKVILQVLCSTGLSVSELSNLKCSDIDFSSATLLVYGKGSKERLLHLEKSVLIALKEYHDLCLQKELNRTHFFESIRKAHI